MKWTIRKLRTRLNELWHFDEVLDVQSEVKSRNTSIIQVEPVNVKGYFLTREQEIILHCQASVKVTMPSTRSLQPVAVDLEFPISERYVYPEFDVDHDQYEETTIVLEHDYIDLELAVVDSLILNLPVQVIGEQELDAELPSGHYWSVVTEDEYKKHKVQEDSQEIDPRFASLKALLNEDNADK